MAWEEEKIHWHGHHVLHITLRTLIHNENDTEHVPVGAKKVFSLFGILFEIERLNELHCVSQFN